METYTLYQFPSCPYCARVRRFLDEARVDLPVRDVRQDPGAYRDLVQGGGSGQVPCLRIEDDGDVRWLYESLDIIHYLRERLPLLHTR